MRIGSTQVTATRPRLSALAAALLALGCMHAAQAIEIRTDDGWSGSFDTTLTYGLAVRASKPDKANIGLGNAAYSPVGGHGAERDQRRRRPQLQARSSGEQCGASHA